MDGGESESESPLKSLIPLWREPVLGGLPRFEMSRNTLHYDSSNTVAALKDVSDIRYVPFGSDMLNSRFLEFWERKGFYSVRVIQTEE